MEFYMIAQDSLSRQQELSNNITHFTKSACCNALNKQFPDIYAKLQRQIVPTDIATVTLERSRVRVAFHPSARPLTYKLIDKEWVCRTAWNPQWQMQSINISPRIQAVIRDDGEVWTTYCGFEDQSLAEGFRDWLLDNNKCAWAAIRTPAERVSQPIECKVWGLDRGVLRNLQGKDLQGRGGVVEFIPCDRITSPYAMISVVIDQVEEEVIERTAIPFAREQASRRGLFILV